MNSAHPLPPSFFSRLSLLRPQVYAHEEGNIDASEKCDKEERAPEGDLDAPSETATSAAPDGYSTSAALDMATCDHGGGGDGSWPSSSSSSSSSPTGNGKEPAVPLPVVESVLSKMRGAAEALVKLLRDETGDNAEGQTGQMEDLQEEVTPRKWDLDSARSFSERSLKSARTVKEEKGAAEDGGSDSHAWPSGNAGRKQKSRLLSRFRSFVDTECTVRTKGGGYEVNVNRRLSLNEAIVQDILGDVEGADKQEDPHIYLPYLPKWAQHILNTRSYIVGRVRAVLKYMTGRNEAERQDRRVVLSAVAAERVEFGDSTGMAASVRRELELPWRGGCTYDAAAMQREKFDLQAVLGAALSVGEVVVVRGEVGELVSVDGNKGTVKFEVAVTGGTRTWTDEYPMLRIHRDIVSLRAPGRMMRSDALALDEATIAGIHRSTAFDSR